MFPSVFFVGPCTADRAFPRVGSEWVCDPSRTYGGATLPDPLSPYARVPGQTGGHPAQSTRLSILQTTSVRRIYSDP